MFNIKVFGESKERSGYLKKMIDRPNSDYYNGNNERKPTRFSAGATPVVNSVLESRKRTQRVLFCFLRLMVRGNNVKEEISTLFNFRFLV